MSSVDCSTGRSPLHHHDKTARCARVFGVEPRPWRNDADATLPRGADAAIDQLYSSSSGEQPESAEQLVLCCPKMKKKKKQHFNNDSTTMDAIKYVIGYVKSRFSSLLKGFIWKRQTLMVGLKW